VEEIARGKDNHARGGAQSPRCAVSLGRSRVPARRTIESLFPRVITSVSLSRNLSHATRARDPFPAEIGFTCRSRAAGTKTTAAATPARASLVL
jgi:hypothetical protein